MRRLSKRNVQAIRNTYFDHIRYAFDSDNECVSHLNLMAELMVALTEYGEKSFHGYDGVHQFHQLQVQEIVIKVAAVSKRLVALNAAETICTGEIEHIEVRANNYEPFFAVDNLTPEIKASYAADMALRSPRLFKIINSWYSNGESIDHRSSLDWVFEEPSPYVTGEKNLFGSNGVNIIIH